MANQNQVDTLILTGNNKTKEHVVLREILHPINHPLDSTILEQDINRLYNLGIFSSVNVNLKDNIYVIDVVESYKVYPWPLISYDEIKKELSYGPGISLRNFFGRNQTFIFGTYLVGEKGYLFS